MFKIFNDAHTIQVFRDQYQNFQIYKSFKQNKTNLVVNIDQLDKYIVQKNFPKQSRNYIHFNTFKDGYKTKEYALLPHTFLLDIDGKSKKQRDAFKNDMNCSTYEQALEKCYNLLKNDECTLYLDYSQSNNGLHCLFTIISDYYRDNENVEIEDNSIIDVLMNENFNIMLEYLKKYNLKFYNSESDDYIDKSLKKITTGVFSSNGDGFYINQNSNIIFYTIDEKIIKTDKPIVKTIDTNTIKELNNRYSYNLFMYGKDNNQKVLNGIKDKFIHYDSGLRLLFSLKYLDVRYKKIYYKLYCNYYQGQSLKKHLRTFETFDKYINGIKDKFITPISSILGFDITDRNSDNEDFFYNKYDKTIYYNNWINEEKEQLFNIFNDKNYIVLKSKAGSGKSTLIFEYINKSFETLNTIVLCSPKNSLLNQQIEIISKEYPNIKIIENYGKKRVKNGNIGKSLILTSTPKLSLIEKYDLLIIDEIHNLMEYSNKIISNVNKNNKLIIISATPEPYLIFEKDYYYINLVKNNSSKKNLNVIISNNFKQTLIDIVKQDEETLIFWNNIDLCKDVERTLGIDFKYLNSKDIDEHNKKCIKDEQLYHTHYFATSYISDGINFKNNNWNKLIIIDNGLSPFEIYQITHRFRLSNPELFLISKGKSSYHKDIDKFFDNTLKGLKDIKYFNDTLDELKKDEILLNQIPELNKHIQKIDNSYILKDINDNYIINVDTIKKDVYNRIFDDYFKVFRNIWENSLKYYFRIHKSFELVENTDGKGFKRNDNLKDIFKKNHYEINFLNFNKKYNIDLMKLKEINNTGNTITIYDMVKDNLTYFITVAKRCEELTFLGYDYKEYLNEVCSKNQNYTKFIHRKRLESINSGVNNDNNSKLYYDRQNEMHNIIINSGIIKHYKSSKQEYYYFTIKDLLEYFNNNKYLYQKFYFSKKYDFVLSSKGLSSYLKLIKRYFEYVMFKTNGETIRGFKLINFSSKNHLMC